MDNRPVTKQFCVFIFHRFLIGFNHKCFVHKSSHYLLGYELNIPLLINCLRIFVFRIPGNFDTF